MSQKYGSPDRVYKPPFRTNGFLKLPLGKRHFVVTGGPFTAYDPESMVLGVKLAAENDYTPCDYWMPIKDFETPTVEQVDALLWAIVPKILAGRRVHFGCAGGWGRTGTVLAILAKTFGIQEPVKYVRENYSRRAVETPAQALMVENYKVPMGLRFMIWCRGIKVAIIGPRDQHLLTNG